MQNVKNKVTNNHIESMILCDKFKSGLFWKCASEVLEGLNNFSGKLVKLASLKYATTTHVKGLG